MKRQRFTDDRLCKPAQKAQAEAMKEYKKYKEELGIEIECRFHHMIMCQPAAFSRTWSLSHYFCLLPLSIRLCNNPLSIQLQVCP